MASSTVSKSFGLLIEVLEAPERTELVSPEIRVPDMADESTLESAPDTADSSFVLLDLLRQRRVVTDGSRYVSFDRDMPVGDRHDSVCKGLSQRDVVSLRSSGE